MVLVNPVRHSKVLQQVGAFKSANNQEVEDGGHSNTSEEGDRPSQVFFVIESEYDTREPHHHQTEDKSDGYGKENGNDDLQGFVCVDELLVGVLAAPYFGHCQCRATSQKSEHH